MLTINQEQLSWSAPSRREAGTVRYSPSFTVALPQLVLVGYAPRLVTDDESGFLLLVDRQGRVNYLNLGLLTHTEARQLAGTLHYDLTRDTPDYSVEDYTWGLSTVVYPASLRGRSLFRVWSWFSPRGFLKNLGYRLGMDNPMWERLTPEMRNYVAQY